jgi:hypothetical protein
MRSASRLISALMIAGAVASPMVVAGCYHHRYESATLTWSDSEGPYYARWEQETHRDHKEWAQRNADEQREYWGWRHDHQ